MRTGAKVLAVGVSLAAVATAGVLVLRDTPGASADAESDCTEPVTRTLAVAPAMADVARSAAATLREDCIELEVEPTSSVAPRELGRA